MTNEIVHEQWAGFVNEFSQRNQGRLTRLEIFGELGAQQEEQHLPLNGITLDPVGSDAPRLAILLGNDAAANAPTHDGRHLTHMVPRVLRLIPKRADDGLDEALEIESANGEKTLLRFEALPRLSA